LEVTWEKKKESVDWDIVVHSDKAKKTIVYKKRREGQLIHFSIVSQSFIVYWEKKKRECVKLNECTLRCDDIMNMGKIGIKWSKIGIK